MKQKFVCATINDRRKGAELSNQNPQPHPLRPVALESSESPVDKRSVMNIGKPHLAPVDLEQMKYDKMKSDILATLKNEKKTKNVPRSKIISMAQPVSEPSRTNFADVDDVIKMLLGKK